MGLRRRGIENIMSSNRSHASSDDVLSEGNTKNTPSRSKKQENDKFIIKKQVFRKYKVER